MDVFDGEERSRLCHQTRRYSSSAAGGISVIPSLRRRSRKVLSDDDGDVRLVQSVSRREWVESPRIASARVRAVGQKEARHGGQAALGA